MRELNHSSPLAATVVHGSIATMVAVSESYAGRLHIAMKNAAVSVQALADHLGVTYQAVKKLLDGKSTEMTASNNAIAAKFLGVASDWLAIGDDQTAQAQFQSQSQSQRPAVREPEPLGSYAILNAASTVAAGLAQLDELTREQVGPLLSRLAQRPDDSQRTLEMLARLLKTS